MKLASCTIAFAVFLFAAGTTAYSQSQPYHSNPAVTRADRAFLKDLAQGNRAEIALGNVAEQNGSTSNVKEFGQRMERDHTSMNKQLSELASSLNVNLPNDMSAKDRNQKSRLEKLSGQAFDKAYLECMLKNHREDVRKVQHMAETTQNQAIKNFAQNLLPQLEDHLRLAENDAGHAGLSASAGLNSQRSNY